MVGLVGLLNLLLALLFPLWPWEIFIIQPFVMLYLFDKAKADSSAKPSVKHMTMFVTGFTGVFCGLGHSAGLIQAIDTVLGGPGICVSALPGAPPDIDTGLMCQMMAVHIFMMVIMGFYFLYLTFIWYKGSPPKNLESAFYSRGAALFIIGGISQDIPYWAVCLQNPSRFGEFMTMKGFYSQRWITPGFTEFISPFVWIFAGFYYYSKSKTVTGGFTMM